MLKHKRHINEKFTEDSDPIEDLVIDTMSKIKKFIKAIEGYIVNKDTLDIYLFVCAEHGKTEWVKYLLNIGADVNYQENLALRWAVFNKHIEIIKILLDAGANVHADKEWPLFFSVRSGYTEIVKILLDAGADVHADKEWALRWAIRKRQTEIVKVLEDHIAKEEKVKKVNEKFVEDSDPVEDLGIGTRKQISKWMKEISEKDTDDNALAECAARGKIEWVKFLLANGASMLDSDYWCLRGAAGRGHADIVKLLIEHGINLDHENVYHAFVWAAEDGQADVIQVFLDAGINLNHKFYGNITKESAKERASLHNHRSIIKLINDYDNKQNKDNNMKAKTVKESLNEKFVEDSDPIEDLKIGLYKYLDILLQKVPWLKYVYPEQKDIDRIRSLVNKSKGDSFKEEMYARNMAKAITDLDKSYRRFKAAEKHGGNGWAVTKIFLQRVLELYGVL